MSAPSFILDGAQVYGTTGLNAVINGVTYQLNNINVTRPYTKAMDRTPAGKPQRQRFTSDVATMTAEAQLATGTTAYPQAGTTFTLTVDSNYGSETWIVMPQEFTASNGEGDIRVVPLKCEKAINPANITTVA